MHEVARSAAGRVHQRLAVATPWTIVSWLTSPHEDLHGWTPLEGLRKECVDEVLALARRTARSMAA